MSILEDLKKTTEKLTGWQRPARTQLDAMLRPGKVIPCRFKDDGMTPNHPRWPLLILKKAVHLPRSLDPAAVFEDIFERNGWRDSWRNGVYDYLHYHSRIHEVMGVARGTAKVRFGGAHGRTIKLGAGDVAILPAGTGHQCIAASRTFLVVGAYPQNGTYDECIPSKAEHARDVARVRKVPRPRKDPAFGREGPPLEKYGLSYFGASTCVRSDFAGKDQIRRQTFAGHVGMDVRRLARSVLSGRSAEAGVVVILRQPVLDCRDK